MGDETAAASLAGAIACAGAALTYALERVVERVVFLEPNPAGLIWSDRSPFFWRAVIAIYAGGAAAIGGFALARRLPTIASRLALALTIAAAVACSLQAAVLP